MKKQWKRLSLILLVFIGLSGCGPLERMETAMEQKSKAVSDENTIVEKESYGEFVTGVIDIIQEYDEKIVDESVLENPYYSRRLILKVNTTGIDLSAYNAEAIIGDSEGLYVLQFATEEDAENAYMELKSASFVEYCEPDQYMTISDVNSSDDFMSWGAEMMGADIYAEYIDHVTDDVVTVAVVDTGVYEHSFLKNRLTSGGMDFVDYDLDPEDMNKHGTHVAGTIADCTPGLNVKILPVRVLDETGHGSWLVIGMGIKYAADQGAEVINLSLSGDVSKLVDDTISYAVDKGCIVVAAAGNNNDNTIYYSPAHLKECIVVSAVSSNLEKASFSNWGESVDVAAPGVNVVSCVPDIFFDRWIWGEKTTSMNGTSMAAPHISAFAAMMKLQYPSITYEGIEELLRESALDLGSTGWDPQYGWGFPVFEEIPEYSVPLPDEEEKETSAGSYETVLSEYRMWATNNLNADFIENSTYINEGAWNFNGRSDCSVFYKYMDLAQDGTPELLIAVCEPNSLPVILDIYGKENGDPVRLIENNSSVGYRTRYYICNDNRIKEKGSGGALNSEIIYYSAMENCDVLAIEERYIYDGQNGYNTYSYIRWDGTVTDISKDEYDWFYSEQDESNAGDWIQL